MGEQLGVEAERPLGPRELSSAIVGRNASRPEIVRLHAVLEAESLAPSHPPHEYFAARRERTLAQFARLAKGTTTDRQSVARQVLATMDGIQMQWLRTPKTVDLVMEWEAIADVLFARLGE